jgi:hypothetical protein
MGAGLWFVVERVPRIIIPGKIMNRGSECLVLTTMRFAG